MNRAMRIVAATGQRASASTAFTPLSLFSGGEAGFAYLPGTVHGASYQERTGASATTLSGNGEVVGTYRDLITTKNFTASADTRRPIHTVSGGLTNHDYDGTDDCLLLSAFDLSGTSAVTLFVACEVDTGAVAQIICEHSANINTNNGSFAFISRDAASGDLSWSGRGATNIGGRRTATATVPRKTVTSCVYDLAQTSLAAEFSPRVDGAVPSLTDAGSTLGLGPFGNFAFYIGARGDASVRFDGRIWGMILVGRVCTAAEIIDTEQYLAGLSGVSF